MSLYSEQTSSTEGVDGEYLWLIQAPYYYLDRFCLAAGLGRDSAVPVVFTLHADRFAEARLTYPGAKCPFPEAWVKVLALLYLHNIPFKIYQATGREDVLTSLTLIEPSIDRELHAILGFAAREKIRQLQRYKMLLERAFQLLREQSREQKMG